MGYKVMADGGRAYFAIGTPKNAQDVCRRLTLSAKSLHSVGRSSKLSHRHGRTDLAPFDHSSLFPKPLIPSRTVRGKSLVNRLPCPNCASTVGTGGRRAIPELFSSRISPTVLID